MLLLSRFSRVQLCDPIDGSPPGPSHGIFQARVLEWVAIAFSNCEPNLQQFSITDCILSMNCL